MYIQSLRLDNFRCFSSIELNFTHPITLIEGRNGSGKTSLLEALYYACYLRSFRTRSPRELLAFGHTTFFIKTIVQGLTDLDSLSEITIGFSERKRQVKVNGSSIETYKQLLELYRIMSITEDDLLLIKGAPTERRAFLDHGLILSNPSYASLLRRYYHILEQRNALLSHVTRYDPLAYDVWSQQLWEASFSIQALRKVFLEKLEQRTNELLGLFFATAPVLLTYESRRSSLGNSYDEFVMLNPVLRNQEQLYKRSLFGAHLDDVSVTFHEKNSRTYSSRGQQKLLVLLLKLAQPALLATGSVTLLLDDIITDLDESILQCLITLLCSFNTQIIFTSPLAQGTLGRHLAAHQHQRISLFP